jgi:hypothetical protein
VNQRFVFLCVAAAAAVSAVSLCAQNRTTIRDTLYNADGSRTAGQIEITWNGFRSAAGKITRRITDGVLDLALVPNAGTTPAGTSYAVNYLLASGLSYSETWAVPQSDTPVSLAAVRVSLAPVPVPLITQQQISEGTGLGALLDFYRAASQTATRAGQCYWNTGSNSLTCSTGAGAWQNYAALTPIAHASSHASTAADPLALNASQITSGTLADARFPNAITGDKTLNGSLTLGSSSLKFTGTLPVPTYPYPADADLDETFPFGAIRVNGKAVAYATDSAFGDVYPGYMALVIPGGPVLKMLADDGTEYVVRRDASEAAADARQWSFALGGNGDPDNPTTELAAHDDEYRRGFLFWSLGRHNTGDYEGYQVLLDPQRAGGTAVGGDFKVLGSSRFSGGTEGPLSHTGNLTVSALTAPPAPSVTAEGQGGSTNWAYKVVAMLDSTSTEASSATSITNGNASLSESNYNQITWNAVLGAQSYDVYRTTAGGTPNTTGKIANVTALALNDTGLAGDTTIAPIINSTGGIFVGTTPNTSFGLNALAANTTGHNNVAHGENALTANTTGVDNTAIGYNALASNTSADGNTANGYYALLSNTTGAANTATGADALHSNTTGNNNTANGSETLFSNIAGNDNTATGRIALFTNASGNRNTANGVAALSANTTGNDNTANGQNALLSNITGSNNVANGQNALVSNTSGNYNTANGGDALHSNTTGNGNTASGLNALYSNSTGNSNTANGKEALLLTTGSSNTAMGDNACNNITAGSNNLCLGAGTTVPNTAGNDQVNLNNFYRSWDNTRTTAQFDKTNDAELADIPGLSVIVTTGKTYRFEAILFTTSDMAAGVKAAIAGGCTATAIIYDSLTINAGLTTQGRAVALGGAVGGVTAVTAAQIKINGTITVNAGGTLTVQFAQNGAVPATTSSVLVGSTFTVHNVP